jgi:hypothetical protein
MSDIKILSSSEESSVEISNDVDDRFDRMKQAMKAVKHRPCPPMIIKEYTKKEEEEMNLIRYGKPTRKSPAATNTSQTSNSLYLLEDQVQARMMSVGNGSRIPIRLNGITMRV